MIQPIFTSDWFSKNIHQWENVVSPHLRLNINPKILEIGVYEGRSTLWLLENFPAAHVTVIDPWDFTDNASDETYKRFKHNIRIFEERVTIIRGTSDKARSLPSGVFDMIYIDGDHRACAVIHDAVLSYELLKQGGLMIFDDYLGGDQGLAYPKPAIDFFHESYTYNNKIELLADYYQRIYRKRLS